MARACRPLVCRTVELLLPAINPNGGASALSALVPAREFSTVARQAYCYTWLQGV